MLAFIQQGALQYRVVSGNQAVSCNPLRAKAVASLCRAVFIHVLEALLDKPATRIFAGQACVGPLGADQGGRHPWPLVPRVNIRVGLTDGD